MSMIKITEQKEVFEAFKCYPWESDRVFQQGLQNILKNMPKADSNQVKGDQDELLEDLQLIRAKHFYFTRFQQNFDLEKYLEYEIEKLNKKQKVISDEQQEELFKRLENYDYENDVEYKKGLPSIIHGWLEQQSKSGLWDKDRLDQEFLKAKAFYYTSRVEKVDLSAYFMWKSKKDQANKPACPFASLWQNKSKVGPADQINASSFVVVQKPKGSGAETITLSSPKSQNILTYDRLNDLKEAIKESENDAQVMSLFITATVADSSNSLDIVSEQRIQTKDTKVISSGLAYNETSLMVSGSELRQVSLAKLAQGYYDTVHSIIQGQTSRLIVTFSNGEIPLNAVYLTLCASFLRVVTEHGLLNFSLLTSHAPIPPLLLLTMMRNRTTASGKHLPNGFELYLALSSPEYGKLRGPELLRLGLVDVFIPEAKLSDAFETAKSMSVCPPPETHSAIQLALAIHHAYAGPNRFQVWEELIEKVFGAAESFDDLKDRLEAIGNNWSKTILAYWDTLPPVLLRVIFKAVKEYSNKEPLELLVLEQKLNEKWRHTDDYKEWLRSKNAWVHDAEQINNLVDTFYFGEDLELSDEEVVVYKAPQETQEDADMPGVCPVTGKKSTAAVCPVTGASNSNNVYPVNGQSASAESFSDNNANGCPFSNKSISQEFTDMPPGVCPVTFQGATA
ncbi:MAG: hypothetical protein EXX96DRAFT_606029 [Benjaminiella poitrasii]|nr:MAG: hypothetical protein EXX96DRAFT_606029 [Benjaminiella poitrasii]